MSYSNTHQQQEVHAKCKGTVKRRFLHARACLLPLHSQWRQRRPFCNLLRNIDRHRAELREKAARELAAWSYSMTPSKSKARVFPSELHQTALRSSHSQNTEQKQAARAAECSSRPTVHRLQIANSLVRQCCAMQTAVTHKKRLATASAMSTEW